MWLLGVAASLLAVVQGSLGQDIASECPAPNGFFADARQCDKYYQCVDNVLTEKLCPDGLGFNDINPHVEKCDLLALVDCSGRTKLQTPKPTENCERQNGNFPVPGSKDCSSAYRCQDGVGTLITCPEGLAFALDTGICDWPDQSGRKGCLTEETQNFTCPRVKQELAVAHPRYADPHDCQYFYVCINGKIPRRNGCKFGQVFNTNTSACDLPQEVPECADYYTEFFDEHFALVERNPSALNQEILTAAILAGYPVPLMTDRVRITPGAAAKSKDKEPREPAQPTPRPGPVRVSPQRPSSLSRPEPQSRPQPGGRQPGDRPLRRRRPGTRRRKTTTTTTTTTAAPEYYDDYYYYDDAYYDNPTAGETPDKAPSDDAASPASDPAPAARTTRQSLPIRTPLLRPRA